MTINSPECVWFLKHFVCIFIQILWLKFRNDPRQLLVQLIVLIHARLREFQPRFLILGVQRGVIHVTVIILISINEGDRDRSVHKLTICIETRLRYAKVQLHYRVVINMIGDIRKLPVLIEFLPLHLLCQLFVIVDIFVV